MAEFDVNKFFKDLIATPEKKSEDKERKGRSVDVPFDLFNVGNTAEFDILPKSDFKQIPSHLSTGPIYFPPTKSLQLDDEYLTDIRRNLPTFHQSRRYWPRELFPDSVKPPSLYRLEVSNARTTIQIQTDESSGQVIGFEEVKVSESDSTALNSTSLLRQPASREDFTRGSTNNFPFMPGGVEKAKKTTESSHYSHESGILRRPPGFDQDVTFGATEIEDIIAPETVTPKQITNPIGLIASYAPLPVEEEEREYKTQRARADQIQNEIMAKRQDQQQQILNFKDVFKQEQHDDDDDYLDEEDSQISEPIAKVSVVETKPPQASQQHDDLDHILSQGEDWISILSKERKKKKDKDWAIMESMDMSHFNELVPNPAIEYPFDLDQFQKEAVYHLENNESVFVAAHTSAGKTVVAEYAIALATKHMTRAIYTSPIKALSNQKFRDFKKTFGDVGLITGDVSINQEASCLIMTTEILRSMLYRGADIIRDVEWVIFDEVHYVNDIDRGVVWEEVIIMLPAHVNFVLLSATVPNTFEFADWIGRTKKKRIYVVGTNKRPVPLEHYVYTAGDIFKVVDEKSSFLSMGYKAAADAFKASREKSKSNYKGPDPKQELSGWNKLITHLNKKTLLPVVCFAFSKKKCEDNAYGLNTIDLTSATEKAHIHVFIEDCVSRLKGTDRRLPQVLRIKELLKRGIGVHHGGLLPIIKEMVEILFSRGLVKVLFATETFAMGVNMPARTVVFNSIQKHDGRQFRDLLPGEYTQMSGRAGRRGLDKVGTVIISCWNEVPDASTVKTMILGKATKLESQFRLTFNMILNLLRVEDFRVEDMIKRSFSEFASQRLLPEQQKMLKKVQDKLQSLEKIDCIYGDPDIENFHALYSEFRSLEKSLQNVIMTSRAAGQMFVPGRIVVVNTPKFPNNLAVMLKVSGSEMRSHMATDQLKSFTCMVIYGGKTSEEFNPRLQTGDQYEITEIKSSEVSRLCKNKLKVETAKVLDKPDKVAIATLVQQLIRLVEEFPLGPPEVDPIKELKINDYDFVLSYQRKSLLSQEMSKSKCENCPKLSEQFTLMDQYSQLRKKATSLQFALSEENLQLMPEFQQRLEVMRRLQYIDEDNAVLIKGRVAREINTVSDELIATELIFENVLTPLSPAEIVAVMSCLIFEEKDESEPTLTERLQEAREHLVAIATSLANVQIEFGMPIVVKDYVKTVNPTMMEVVYEWARGMPFSDICQITNIQEGSIVRCITRLDETCKEVRNAARIIGDSALYSKMEQASQLIKRDIVFASSLYIT